MADNQIDPTQMAYPLPHNHGDQCLLCEAFQMGHFAAFDFLWKCYLEFAADPAVVEEDAVVRDFLQSAMERLGITMQMDKREATKEELMMLLEGEGGVQ